MCIVWTSGTTGLPKGAWFDHRALEASARLSNILSAYHDVRLMPVPFPHAGYMNKLWDQVEFVINSRAHRHAVDGRVDARAAWSRERVTVGQGVPTQWSKLVDLPQLADADLSSLRLCSTGSAPVTPELAEKMRTRLGCPIVVRYACTESSSITGTRVDDPPEVLLHTVGRPQEGIELVLRRRRRRAGAAAVRWASSRCARRAACAAYWNDPERTADTLSPDGWITTSDLGTARDDGNLVLRGRTSEMYIRGGFNIHPLEVERVVADHPKVGRVAIVGTPAPTIGEIGVAFVEPVDPADPPTLEELRAFVRERLADYKAPDRLEVVAELPMTSMLKIDKRVLQTWPLRRPERRPGSASRARKCGITCSPKIRIDSSISSWVSVPIWIRHITLSTPAVAQPLDVGDGGVGVAECVVGVVHRRRRGGRRVTPRDRVLAPCCRCSAMNAALSTLLGVAGRRDTVGRRPVRDRLGEEPQRAAALAERLLAVVHEERRDRARRTRR